jgi:ElaB/YqjD/DUF883 family membrane-anchored ribosome-binding protein
MNVTMTSTDKINEALRLLDEAARDKKHELRDLMGNQYHHLRDVVTEGEHNLIRMAARAKEEGVEKAKKAAGDVDKHVRDHPWPYIGGIAVTALLVGYIMGRNRR